MLVAMPEELELREDNVLKLMLDAILVELYWVREDNGLDLVLTAGVDELAWREDVALKTVDEYIVLSDVAALLKPCVDISADVELKIIAEKLNVVVAGALVLLIGWSGG